MGKMFPTTDPGYYQRYSLYMVFLLLLSNTHAPDSCFSPKHVFLYTLPIFHSLNK